MLIRSKARHAHRARELEEATSPKEYQLLRASIIRRSLSRRAVIAGVAVLMALSAGVSWKVFHDTDIDIAVTGSTHRPLILTGQGQVKQMPAGDYLDPTTLVDTTGCSSTNVIAWNGTQFACAAGGGGGGGITNSAGNNVVMKSNGTNAVASAASDNGTTFAIAENMSVATGTGQAAMFSTKRAGSTDGFNVCIGGGCQSVALGGNSTTGSNNTGLGINALNSVTTGRRNTVGGVSAMASAVDNTDNVAIGYNAFATNTTSGADGNVAIGASAMSAGDGAATRDVAIGYQALNAVTSGFSDVAIGWASSAALTTASDDIAIGTQSLQVATTGSFNVSVGPGSLRNLTTGSSNTAVGNHCGTGLTTGTENTIIGAYVGDVTGALGAAMHDWILIADGSGLAEDRLWFSMQAPTSVSHGSLGTASTNSRGNVTTIGAFTSVVLTYSNTFPNRSWCVATVNASTTPEFIVVTNSASAPTFSCFNSTTGAAANCVDFTYWCSGE